MERGSTAGSVWDDAKWARYGFFAGVLFVVVNLISTFAPGAPPARDASESKIASYYADHAGGMKLGGVLFGIALVLGFWWLGSLWRVISRLEPAGPRLALIAAGAFLVSGALASVSQAVFIAPAFVAPETNVLVFWQLGFLLYSLVLAAVAAHMLALAALTLWVRFLPSWLGWLAMLSGVASLGAIGGLASDSGAFVALQMIGFISWLLWVLLASLLLARRTVD